MKTCYLNKKLLNNRKVKNFKKMLMIKKRMMNKKLKPIQVIKNKMETLEIKKAAMITQ